MQGESEGRLPETLQAPGRLMKWINVVDRLPREGQEVLVTALTGPGADGEPPEVYVEYVMYEDGFFHGFMGALDVIAWMPMPEPWEG